MSKSAATFLIVTIFTNNAVTFLTIKRNNDSFNIMSPSKQLMHKMELMHLYCAEPTSKQANTLGGSVDNSANADTRSNEQSIGLPGQKGSIFEK